MELQNPRCPNCNFTLVLLEKRIKYKCPKCSKLYSKLEIDAKNFRKYNKVEREKSRKQYSKESNQNSQAKKIIPKIIEDLNKPRPQKTLDKYYRKNKAKIFAQRKAFRLANWQMLNERARLARKKNIVKKRFDVRLAMLRTKQRRLALEFLKNGVFTAYKPNLDNSLPIMLLS